jgi:integrase/recombinase XerC
VTGDVGAALVRLREASLQPQAVRLGVRLAQRLRRLSEHTRAAYGSDLAAFAAWAGSDDVDAVLRGLVSLGKADAEEVGEQYLAQMVEDGLAPATINRRLSALRAVVKIARRAEICPWDLEIEGVRAKTYKDTKGPGLDAVRQMLAVARADGSPRGTRDYAVLVWLYVLALRRIELVRLDLADLQHDEGGWSVLVWGKGARERAPEPLDPFAYEALAGWLAHRGSDPGPLFCSLHRRHRGAPARLDPSTINRIVRDRAIEAGFPDGRLPDGRSIRPHGFRHTAITRTAKRSGLQAAQELARHKDPATTQRYLDNLGETVRASQADLAEDL